MSWLFAVTLCLLVWSIGTRADAGELGGKVTVNGQRGARDAIVRVHQGTTGPLIVTTVDRDGNYRIVGVSDGQYQMQVEADGQVAFDGVVKVSGSSHRDVDLVACTRVRTVVKTSLQDSARSVSARPVKLSVLLELAAAPGLTQNDGLYQGNRIPLFPNPLNLAEGDIIRAVGWLRSIDLAATGAYTLKLTTTAAANEAYFGKTAYPPCVGEKSLRAQSESVRRFIRDKFLNGKEPPVQGVAEITPPVPVEMTGQLFYDTAIGALPIPTEPRLVRKSRWEFHPIVDLRIVR